MTNQEIGQQAKIFSHQKVIELAEESGVTKAKVFERLNQALDAEEVKVFNDKDAGIIYSAPLIAHAIRLKAVELAANLLDLRPATKQIIGEYDLGNMSDEELKKEIEELVGKSLGASE